MIERHALHVTATASTFGRTCAVIAVLLTAVVALLAPSLVVAAPFTIVSTPASDSLTVLDLSSNSVMATLPLSGLPTGSALNGRVLYVALSGSNSLALVNLVTGGIDYVPVGVGPTGVAVGRRSRSVYVANTGDGTVSVFDPRLATVARTITVGDRPVALVTGVTRLYVANAGGGTVSVIDTMTDAVLATIPVGSFPFGLALDARADRLYVANFFDDTVSVIDTNTLSVVSTIPVARRPRSLALNAKKRRLFVAGFEDGRLQVIDTRTGIVTQEAPSGGQNPVDLMLGPLGKHLYVAHFQDSRGVVVLNAATLAPVTSVGVPAGPVSFAGLSTRRPPSSLSATWLASAQVLLQGVKAMAGSVLGSAFGSAAVSLAAGDDVVISDDTFNLADWAVTGTGEHETTQEATGGNPGAWRRTIHFGPANTVHRLIRPGSAYNPAQAGISSIDVSWDRRLLAESVALEGFVVEQNEIVYRTTERALFLATFQTDRRTGLVASDFDDGGGRHPDFSAGGSPLRFGYFRRTTTGQTLAHGIDNFVVTVHPLSANQAGTLAFVDAVVSVQENEAPFINVERRGGKIGAVSAEVHTERPDGSVQTDVVAWPDGNDSPRSLLILGLGLPDGAGARTARLTFHNIVGGAEIHPSRGVLLIMVFPLNWTLPLQALFFSLLSVFGGFSPAWLLALAVPVALAAHRVWRRERSRARAHSQR
jgi:YVTN family beta-propeller protein